MPMQYLSLHIIFSIKVDIRQYQECIQNVQNMNFDFFAPEFGALPILQDCPWCPHDPWYVILGHSQSFWVIMGHI